ncbi:hypothetical protein BJ742DRAFT_850847 [Cladochytrium replicatum]|nr:hypothetical protein BJ742DRAFT_850847 [Cladochytrium replicatum]
MDTFKLSSLLVRGFRNSNAAAVIPEHASRRLLSSISPKIPPPKPSPRESAQSSTSTSTLSLEPRHYALIGLCTLFLGGTAYYNVYYYRNEHGKDTYQPLDRENFRRHKLIKIFPLTHDTSILRFGSSIPETHAGKNSGPLFGGATHMIVKDDTCEIARQYSPVQYFRNGFDLMVKRYDDGSVSRYLHKKAVGDMVEMRGPIVTFPYEPNMVENLGLIAGGTGIAPFIQVIKGVLFNPHDSTKLHLIYANKTEGDILLREELDNLSQEYPDRLKIHYTLDYPPDEIGSGAWKGGKGFISDNMIKKWMPPKSDKTLILVCGPQSMIRHVAGMKEDEDRQGRLGGLLKAAGYTEQQVWKF